MQNFMKTIISAVQTWTKGEVTEVDNRVTEVDNRVTDSVADWNETDESSLSYIKNRPFYDDSIITDTILEETTIIFDYSSDTTPELGQSIDIIADTQYIVTFDGYQYLVTCIEGEGSNSFNLTLDGINIEIYDSGTINYRTGDPTLLDGEHTIKIEAGTYNVKTIDKKFLPDIAKNAESAKTVAESAKTVAESAKTVADSKMDAKNPVGTGSLSMKRLYDSTVGSHSTTVGYDGTASAYCSFASGKRTISRFANTSVFGSRNLDDTVYGELLVRKNVVLSGVDSLSGVTCGPSYSIVDNEIVINDEVSTIVYIWQVPEGYYFTSNFFTSNTYNKNVVYRCVSSYVSSDGNNPNYSECRGKITVDEHYIAIPDGYCKGRYAQIVGNGMDVSILDQNFHATSNAYTLDWSGNAWYAGDVYTGSTSGTNKDDGSKKLATEEYVDEKIAATNLLVATVSNTNGTLTCDYTCEALLEACNSGVDIVVDYDGLRHYLTKNAGTSLFFTANSLNKNTVSTIWINSTSVSNTVSSGTFVNYASAMSLDDTQKAQARENIGALSDDTVIPTKTSDLTNDSGFITTETDPTVPDWAKASTKPSYTASEITVNLSDTSSEPASYIAEGNLLDDALMKLDVELYNQRMDINDALNYIEKIGVRKINGYTFSGDIDLTASDVGADASGTAESLVTAHNTATDAHADIREEIAELSSKIVSEVMTTTQERYASMTQSDLATLYTQGVRIIAVVDNTYTNLVALSIDADGNVYNGTGYMDGYRLNSSGEVVADTTADFTVTGFIPYVANSTIRSKGSTNAAADAGGQYIIFYDSNFAAVGLMHMSVPVSSGYATYEIQEDGYYLLTVDTSNITAEEKDTYAYFRISHNSCFGKNLIVTINEEI